MNQEEVAEELTVRAEEVGAVEVTTSRCNYRELVINRGVKFCSEADTHL